LDSPPPPGPRQPARACPPRQHQEDSLKGVLRVLLVTQQAPADAEDHRPVTGNQQRKRGLVALAGEPRQQLPVGQGTEFRPTEPARLSEDRVYVCTGHEALRAVTSCSC